jgi:hypothetical protein
MKKKFFYAKEQRKMNRAHLKMLMSMEQSAKKRAKQKTKTHDEQGKKIIRHFSTSGKPRQDGRVFFSVGSQDYDPINYWIPEVQGFSQMWEQTYVMQNSFTVPFALVDRARAILIKHHYEDRSPKAEDDGSPGEKRKAADPGPSDGGKKRKVVIAVDE